MVCTFTLPTSTHSLLHHTDAAADCSWPDPPGSVFCPRKKKLDKFCCLSFKLKNQFQDSPDGFNSYQWADYQTQCFY